MQVGVLVTTRYLAQKLPKCVPDNLRGAPLSRVLEKRNRRKKMGV